jgi:hypothetical protein
MRNARYRLRFSETKAGASHLRTARPIFELISTPKVFGRYGEV